MWRRRASRAFGFRAEQYAERLDSRLTVVLADASRAVYGLAAAIDLRSSGKTFLAGVVCDDRRALAARAVGGLFAAAKTSDERRAILEQLEAEQKGAADESDGFAEPWDDATAKTLRDFAKAGDALLARSRREQDRLERRLGVAFDRATYLPGETRLPRFKRGGSPDAIVVWAPQSLSSELCVISGALEHLNSPILLACRDGVPLRRALERAALVVDADIGSAAAAIAFAERGIPVVATSTSGADEFLDGIQTYDPWSWRAVLRAAATARALPAPVPHGAMRQRLKAVWAVLDSAAPHAIHGPLVSITLPTYNRREQLRATLDSLKDQIYKDIEVIVVNDAGEPVDDIVRACPFARLLNREVNGGTTAARNDAIQASRGEYIAFISDDDEVFPDHISRLVAALFKSGLKVAYANVINRLQEETRKGPRTYGYLLAYDGIIDPVEAMWSMTTNTQGFLFHRSVFDEVGLPDAGFPIANDYEFTIRIAQRYDVAHVNRVTSAHNYCATQDTVSIRSGTGLIDDVRAVYAKYPATGRPLIEDRRRLTVAGLEEAQGNKDYWPAPIRLDS
jgi:hypothetical protein